MGQHSLTIEPPLASNGSKTLAAGEKLIFWRDGGGLELQPRVEVSQKLVHCLRVHFLDQYSAFCKLDAQGDVREVIGMIDMPGTNVGSDGVVITVKRDELLEYMAVGEMGMVTLFDFTQTPPTGFHGFHGDHREHRTEVDVSYDVGVMQGHASFAAGRLIVRPTSTVEALKAERERARDPGAQQYATFKIVDWKNDQEVEVSCSPDSLSSYFEPDAPLPLQISPAFFSAEVLLRFKADHDKYTLTERSIACRGAWSLKTYDINEAGQVHTYIHYLGDLPYKEQVYWQSFNEWPKGPISARGFETDIRGSLAITRITVIRSTTVL